MTAFRRDRRADGDRHRRTAHRIRPVAELPAMVSGDEGRDLAARASSTSHRENAQRPREGAPAPRPTIVARMAGIVHGFVGRKNTQVTIKRSRIGHAAGRPAASATRAIANRENRSMHEQSAADGWRPR